MAITSLNDYIAALKQRCILTKTATRTSTALASMSVFDLAGSPGPGALAGVSTVAGVVPVAADAGYPNIQAFPAGLRGYLSRLSFGWNVAGRLSLYDRLFVAGAYAFNADQVLAGQPSFLNRIPGDLPTANTELWLETVVATATGHVVQVYYTNQNGVPGRTTGAITVGTTAVGRMTQLPLQSGDQAVLSVDRVVSTVATAGTFNVCVMRPIAADGLRVPLAGFSTTYDMLSTGLPQIFETSALFLMATPDSTSTQLPFMTAEVAIG